MIKYFGLMEVFINGESMHKTYCENGNAVTHLVRIVLLSVHKRLHVLFILLKCAQSF